MSQLARDERNRRPEDLRLKRFSKRMLENQAQPASSPTAKQSSQLDTILLDQREPDVLDLRQHLAGLSDSLLWRLGQRCGSRISTLDLTGWLSISSTGLRSIALAFGDRLESLNFSSCPVDDDMVKVLSVRFFALRSLNVSRCERLTNTSMRFLAEGSAATLASLDLSWCSQIHEESCGWLAGTLGHSSHPCGALMSLNLEGCKKLRDLGLTALGKGCRSLQFVNVCGCALITDLGVAGLANGCRFLRVINLRDCVLIGDGALSALGACCTQLRSVNASRCSRIGDLGLLALARGAPGLQSINIAGCVL